MVADRIKDIIDSRGIKYTFIAEKTGMPVDRISKLLNRQRRMLADEMLSICGVIGINPLDLADDPIKDKKVT